MKLENGNFPAIEIKFFWKSGIIDHILLLNKVSSDEKNFQYSIGYLEDDYKIKSLFIVLQKTSTYVKGHDDETKWISFLIKDADLLNKYNDTWNKVNNSLKTNLTASLSTIKKNSESQNKVLQWWGHRFAY